MLRISTHEDVTQLEFSTWRSRAMGFRVSAFAVRGVLIDTGFPGAAADLEGWLEGARIAGAIVTHSHEDHAGNVEWLARRGVPLALAPGTAALVQAPKPIGSYRRLCWGTASPLRSAVAPFAHPSLALLPALGHSPDHHVVWDAERETIFGGDLFIGVKVRLAHPGQDIRGEVRALRSVIALGPRRFFDAHRGLIGQPLDQLRAKAEWMEEMIGEIERRAGEGWSVRAIRDAVLGREDLTGWVSAGDYSRMNLVRSILSSSPSGGRSANES